MTVELNLLDPAYQLDPYGALATLRETAQGVHWQEQAGAWLVLRHEDVSAALRDHRRFSSGWMGAVAAATSADDDLGVPQNAVAALRRSLLFSDPPQHTRLRKLVSAAFTPRAVDKLRSRIEQITDGLCADLSAPGVHDLVSEFASVLPIEVIADLLEVPVPDRVHLARWSDAGTLAVAPVVQPAARAAALDIASEFTEYMRGLVRRRRREPGDDVLSALLAAEAGGSRLSENECIAIAQLLLVAGNETTRTLLSNAGAILVADAAARDRLVADGKLWDTAVEEVLRVEPPVQFTLRMATEDMLLGDHRVRAGQGVMLALGAANRDPRQFEDPDRLDVGRTPNRHLAFGAGAHFCLGAPLARLEAAIALPRVLDLLGRARLVERPTYRHDALTRGLPRLLVEW